MSVESTESIVHPEPPRDEAERLDPQPVAQDGLQNDLKLANGAPFKLEPLKLRQFLRLLRIITHGAAQNLDNIDLDFDDTEKFVAGFISLVIFAIPDAEEETVQFLQSIVSPADLDGKPAAKGDEQSADDRRWNFLYENLINPTLDDTLTIIQRLVEVEGEDLRALGKRLAGMLTLATKMGALDKNKDVQTP